MLNNSHIGSKPISETKETGQAATPHPKFTEAFRFWLKLGFISFGGPAGQISIMHRELVDRKKWASNERFLNALNYCMLLPGPEAQQLATYIGWLLHRLRGGIVAGAFFVIPSIFIFLGGPYIEKFRDNPKLSASLSSITAAVVGVVLNLAVWFGLQVLKPADGGFNLFAAVVGLAAFVSIQWLNIGMITVIAAAGALGFFWYQIVPLL